MSLSKDKGKQIAMPSTIPPLPSPSAGSASPASSLPTLWSYLFPALDHIVRSGIGNIEDTEKITAPPIAIDYHMGIHTNVYNYFTAQSESTNGTKKGRSAQISGADLYEQLDKYYAATARELLLGAPDDDTMLIHYLVSCFRRFYAGAASASRLLHYVNRHYVKRAVDEDKGWLRLNDVLDAVARTITEDDTREKIAKRLKKRRTEELKKWGYEDGGSAELLAEAEACAEAASTLDRIVPLASVALRRFRTEFIEPLLKVPKIKAKGKKKRPPVMNGDKALMPKGRLARAVKELLETQRGDDDEKRRLAMEVATMLRTVGVRADQPLRKKLDKFEIATAVQPNN
jgi:hypothetical protein